MKSNFATPSISYNFCAKKKIAEDAGKVEYSNPYFLEREKQAAKAHIEEYIKKSESEEVLTHKGKKIFSKIGQFTENILKKFPKKH